MNSKDMINNVNQMQGDIDSNIARVTQLNNEVNERKTSIDTIQDKAQELTQKEANVKVKIVNAMNTKGLNASTSDSYDTLANKLKTIDNSSDMYSYAMTITYSSKEPINPTHGDIWISTDDIGYKLVFTDSTDSLGSPSTKEIYMTYYDSSVLEINFDETLLDYTNSNIRKLYLQISSNTFINGVDNNYIPVIISELNRLLIKPKNTYRYLESTRTYLELKSYWYDGKAWCPIKYTRNPNLVLYARSDNKTLYALDKDTGSQVWTSSLTRSGDQYLSCAIGYDSFCVVQNTSSSSYANIVEIFNVDGSSIRSTHFNYHSTTDSFIQSACYCKLDNTFITFRCVSSTQVKVHKYDASTGEQITNNQFDVDNKIQVIKCMGDKIFISPNTNSENVKIYELNSSTLQLNKIHYLKGLNKSVIYNDYLFLVDFSTTTDNNIVINKYQYANGAFNLIKSASFANTSKYTCNIELNSNPSTHEVFIVLEHGKTSGGFYTIDLDLNKISEFTDSQTTPSWQRSPYTKLNSLNDGRIVYSLSNNHYSNRINIFNLLDGNSMILASNSGYAIYLLGTTVGLLNDFPYEY